MVLVKNTTFLIIYHTLQLPVLKKTLKAYYFNALLNCRYPSVCPPAVVVLSLFSGLQTWLECNQQQRRRLVCLMYSLLISSSHFSCSQPPATQICRNFSVYVRLTACCFASCNRRILLQPEEQEWQDLLVKVSACVHRQQVTVSNLYVLSHTGSALSWTL